MIYILVKNHIASQACGSHTANGFYISYFLYLDVTDGIAAVSVKDATDGKATALLKQSPSKEEPQTHDNELAKELRRISKEYLTSELTEAQKALPSM